MEIPGGFLNLPSPGEGWPEWLRALPRLVRDVLGEWELTADGPTAHGKCAVVVPVLTAQGDRAAVKFGWPHLESEHEHLVLREWAGAGAVRLLRADPQRSVLLLERAGPADLTTVPAVEACEIVAGLYPRLHVPAPPQLDLLSGHAARWAGELSALPASALVPRRYVDQAASLARDFATDDGTDGRAIHTDLHYDNVLAGEREPWLAIDPKPLSGDPCFEVAPLLWNRWEEVAEAGGARRATRERFHAVVDAAGLDEDRARDWVVVRELVNILWTLQDSLATTQEDRDWTTNALTIVKAVQD